MHYSTNTEDIKSAIEQLRHTVLNIHNIQQQRTNTPLSLFLIDLKPQDNNKDVYHIETLNRTKVQFEPPRPKRAIPQCGKCQRYGHTKAYCYHNPRCVKCAGTHSTTNCPSKERSDQVKCVLCSGNHPANYKGCTVYKELQLTIPSLRPKPDRTPVLAQSQTYTRPDLSYAPVLAPHQQRFETANPSTRQLHTSLQHIYPKRTKYKN
jgi:hypothetical protein